MTTTAPPAAERVVSAFRQLTLSSQKLDNAVQGWTRHIALLNEALREKAKVGVSAWHQIAGNDSDPRDWWSREIGYAQVNGEWCIALRRRWGDMAFPDDDREELWRFEDAPRWLMIDAAGKIPELLETLVKRTEEATAKVQKRSAETEELAKALNAVVVEGEGWISAAITAADNLGAKAVQK